MDDPAVERLRDLKLRGLIITPRDERTYPNTELAAHVLGFIDDATGHGTAGMEKELDKLLTGEPGERWVERDAKRNDIAAYQTSERPAVDGDNVTLTIRLAIQHVVEEELDGSSTDVPSQRRLHHRDGPAHRRDPRDGLAAPPTIRTIATFKPDAVRNRCITDMVEPGSIFKIITLAAALNEGLVNLDTPINCENGSVGTTPAARPEGRRAENGDAAGGGGDGALEQHRLCEAGAELSRADRLYQVRDGVRHRAAHGPVRRPERDGGPAPAGVEMERAFGHAHSRWAGSRRLADPDGHGDERDRQWRQRWSSRT